MIVDVKKSQAIVEKAFSMKLEDMGRLELLRCAAECVVEGKDYDRRLGAALAFWILKMKRDQERVVTYPTTWWDSVKNRWAPEWYLKRWPINRTIHKFTASMWFPELNNDSLKFTEVWGRVNESVPRDV